MRVSYPVANGNKNPTPNNFRLEHYDNRTEMVSYSTVVAVLPLGGHHWIYGDTYSATTRSHIYSQWPREEYMQESFDRILGKLRNGEGV